jgi:hypothetical protein
LDVRIIGIAALLGLEPFLLAEPVAIADGVVPGDLAGGASGLANIPLVWDIIGLETAKLLDGDLVRGNRERALEPSVMAVFSGRMSIGIVGR